VLKSTNIELRYFQKYLAVPHNREQKDTSRGDIDIGSLEEES
jgi:hypothetical protein